MKGVEYEMEITENLPNDYTLSEETISFFEVSDETPVVYADGAEGTRYPVWDFDAVEPSLKSTVMSKLGSRAGTDATIRGYMQSAQYKGLLQYVYIEQHEWFGCAKLERPDNPYNRGQDEFTHDFYNYYMAQEKHCLNKYVFDDYINNPYEYLMRCVIDDTCEKLTEEDVDLVYKMLNPTEDTSDETETDTPSVSYNSISCNCSCGGTGDTYNYYNTYYSVSDNSVSENGLITTPLTEYSVTDSLLLLAVLLSAFNTIVGILWVNRKQA